MHIRWVRHLWGVTTPRAVALATFRGRGYELIEAPLPSDDTFARELSDNGLGYLAMAFTEGASVDAHFDSLRRQVDQAHALRAVQLTVHSGSDAWTAEQTDAFYTRVVEFERTAPFPMAHETHRGRVFFNPWTTARVLRTFPTLRVCVDFSHWVCVAERLIHDCPAEIELAAHHAIHLHARVGYAQGPQVPDPSAPEYRAELEAHEGWWRRVIDAHRNRGATSISITPEFGPPGYLHTLPHTNVPVADLDSVVEWMKARLAQSLKT
jgi:hypothetical protein